MYVKVYFMNGPPSMRNTVLIAWLGVGSSNNYAYLVSDEKTKDAVIIDPANPPE